MSSTKSPIAFEEQSFSVATTAKILDCSEPKIFKMIRAKEINSFTVGRSRKITGAMINAFRAR